MLFAIILFATAPAATASGDVAQETGPAETLKIDILVKQSEAECEARSEEEIIVCADKADNEQHRLRPIAHAERYEKDESKAEFAIAENATMAVEADAVGLPGGVQSNRMMVRLKMGF